MNKTPEENLAYWLAAKGDMNHIARRKYFGYTDKEVNERIDKMIEKIEKQIEDESSI